MTTPADSGTTGAMTIDDLLLALPKHPWFSVKTVAPVILTLFNVGKGWGARIEWVAFEDGAAKHLSEERESALLVLSALMRRLNKMRDDLVKHHQVELAKLTGAVEIRS